MCTLKKNTIIPALLIALLACNLTVLSQVNLQYSDSLKRVISTALTAGNECAETLAVKRLEISNLTFQVSKQGDRINTLMFTNSTANRQKATLQAEITACDAQIQLRDKEIIRLKTTKWIIIGVGGAAIVGAVVLGVIL